MNLIKNEFQQSFYSYFINLLLKVILIWFTLIIFLFIM